MYFSSTPKHKKLNFRKGKLLRYMSPSSAYTCIFICIHIYNNNNIISFAAARFAPAIHYYKCSYVFFFFFVIFHFRYYFVLLVWSSSLLFAIRGCRTSTTATSGIDLCQNRLIVFCYFPNGNIMIISRSF